MVVGGSAYLVSFNTVRDTSIRAYRNMLEQGQETMDRRYIEIIRSMNQVVTSPKVSYLKYLKRNENKKELITLMDAQKTLYDFKLNNDFIHDYGILLTGSQYIFNKESIYQTESYFSHKMLLTTETQKKLNDHYDSYQVIAVEGDKKVKLALIKSIGQPYQPYANIIMYLKQEMVESIFANFNLKEGALLITDVMGVKLLETGSEYNEGELRYVNYEVNSSVNGWHYKYNLPINTVFKDLNLIKRTTIYMEIISLFICILLALILAKRNVKPLYQLQEQNADMHREMESYKPLLRSVYIERLLNGCLESKDELLNYIGYDYVEKVNQQYRFILMEFSQASHNEESLINESLKLQVSQQIVQRIPDEKYLIHILEGRRIGLIYLEKKRELDKFLVNLKDFMRKTVTHKVRITLGEAYGDLIDVHRSYSEAKQTMDYISPTSDFESLYFKDIPKRVEAYYYPFDIENKIIQSVIKYQEEQLQSTLREIYTENIMQRQLTKNMLSLFVKEMWGTVVKITERYHIKDEELVERILRSINQTKDQNDLQVLQNNMKIFHELCIYFRNQADSQGESQWIKVKGYIDQHYNDNMLSLARVAEEFNMSEGSMSRYFKEKVGENFIDYLSHQRIHYAKELLKETDDPIKQIVELVGYISYNTFSRAFKRVVGMSAGEYRKQHK